MLQFITVIFDFTEFVRLEQTTSYFFDKFLPFFHKFSRLAILYNTKYCKIQDAVL